MQQHSTQVRLTGPYAGRTCVLNRHSFVKGVATIVGQPEEINFALVYLARCYQAYAVGSPALSRAIERDLANGIQHHVPSTPSVGDGTPKAVPSDGVQPAGFVSGQETLHDGADVRSKDGPARLVSGGPGHGDAGVGNRVEPGQDRQSRALMEIIKKLVNSFDWKNEELWTSDGWPAVGIVADALGDANITREDVDVATNYWSRRRAQDRAEHLSEDIAAL